MKERNHQCHVGIMQQLIFKLGTFVGHFSLVKSTIWFVNSVVEEICW
jgi:hypothetical protein